MNTRTAAYWGTTGPFCLVLTVSGFAHFSHQPFIAVAMTNMGYPLFVSTMLGIAKLLGVAALLAPGQALLKEWAYAGFTFNLLGASASHVFAGDPLAESLPPLALLALAAASYLLRPASRRVSSAPTLGSDALAADPSPAHG